MPEGDNRERRFVIGWRERVSLPEWGIERVRAKIDTGARTSAIHVSEIQEQEDGTIRFEVVTRERPTRRTIWVNARPVRHSVVKGSGGDRQPRLVCRTEMRLGSLSRPVEISLVSRKGMLCRMLVGRKAIEGHFVVDPSRTYVATKRRKPPHEEERGSR